MIHTATQLKAVIRNHSCGNSMQAQILLRRYMMERFLERVSKSKYKKYFILKGGMLISSIIGYESRTTMDIDSTMKNMSLTIDGVSKMVTEINNVNIDDNISFSIKNIDEIMEGQDYPGIRVSMDAHLDTMSIPIKLDLSIGDIITPKEIKYRYKLMFEDREIDLYSYNLETVLSEKMSSVITLGVANTRLRDFYDIYILLTMYSDSIDYDIFKDAYNATRQQRGFTDTFLKKDIIRSIYENDEMQNLWSAYQKKFIYAKDISWDKLMSKVEELYRLIL